MAWKKGQSGNPFGRQKGIRSEAEKLRQAVKKVEKERGVDFYQHFCERALEDNHILIALMKKLVPDMKQIEQSVDLQSNYGVIAFPTKVPVGAECADSEIDTGEGGK